MGRRGPHPAFYGGIIGGLLVGLLRATVGEQLLQHWWGEAALFLLFLVFAVGIAAVVQIASR